MVLKEKNKKDKESFSSMDNVEKKIKLVTKYPTIEVLTVEDLRKLFESGEQLHHYIGFEISGLVHLGSGLFCGAKIADLQKAGVKVKIFLADWHSWINGKLGERWEAYERIGKWFGKTLQKCVELFGGDGNSVELIFGSELYHNNDEYWKLVVEISKMVPLSRIKRSTVILGRKSESVNFAQLLYVPMQAADIFEIGAHLPHGGIDQRKVHVIAREVALKLRFGELKLGNEKIKPVAVHGDLLLSFSMTKIPNKDAEKDEITEELKMSKSKPGSAVFLHEDPEDIKKAVLNAFCPAGEIEWNPIIQLAKLLFRDEESIVIPRSAKFGGDLELQNVDELLKVFKNNELHPLDLKNAVAEKLIEFIKPVNKWLREGEGKKFVEEIKNVQITR